MKENLLIFGQTKKSYIGKKTLTIKRLINRNSQNSKISALPKKHLWKWKLSYRLGEYIAHTYI